MRIPLLRQTRRTAQDLLRWAYRQKRWHLLLLRYLCGGWDVHTAQRGEESEVSPMRRKLTCARPGCGRRFGLMRSRARKWWGGETHYCSDFCKRFDTAQKNAEAVKKRQWLQFLSGGWILPNFRLACCRSDFLHEYKFSHIYITWIVGWGRNFFRSLFIVCRRFAVDFSDHNSRVISSTFKQSSIMNRSSSVNIISLIQSSSLGRE